MKRIIAIILSIVMVFSLAACGNEQTAEINCSSCGGSISTKATFCEHCGTAVGNINSESEDASSDNSSSDITSSTNSEESKPVESSEPAESSKPATSSKPSSSSAKPSSNQSSTSSTPATPSHTHSFSAATCTAPKKCSCGATEGSALGHNYNTATCTAPKTCKTCGKTEGSALGHSYREGICSRCGAVDNNYVPKDIQVETILFDEIYLSMMAGDTELLGVTIYPYNATNQTLYWESSDSSVVEVDSVGNLTAKSYGSATISAHTSNGVYATDCQVLVKANPILTCNDFPLHLYSDDGKEYLGKLVTNKYDSDGIWNEYGKYGSKYQTNSIWNEYGKYGSKYQSTSAFNPYASKPPKIVTNSGRVIGYLTASEYKANGYTIIQLERALKSVGQ